MGPFKGKYSGQRKYQVNFSKSNSQMGTYHVIDGTKVRVFYNGNVKTCGNCHRNAASCPGEAVAKQCIAAGGKKVYLSDHMKELWAEVGFTPVTFKLDETDKSTDSVEQAAKDGLILSSTSFPTTVSRPELSKKDIEKANGISIRNFPLNIDHDTIISFLSRHGLPTKHNYESIIFDKSEKAKLLCLIQC